MLLRLDRAFKIGLPEKLIVDANSPRDLLDAVECASPEKALKRSRTARARAARGVVAEPTTATTLPEMLAAHVQNTPDRPHLWLWQSDEKEHCTSYKELSDTAHKVAGGLLERGLQPGERVAIMLPTELAFFESFYGIILAGGVPVPIYPPFRRTQVEEHLKRQAGILRNAEAAFLVTDAEIHRVGVLLHSLTSSVRKVEIAAELRKSARLATPAGGASEATALIQYTSGSTGDPKGVVLSHANLLANIRAMGTTMEATSSDVFVSWLPVYHDMGLIGAWLGCLYYGVPTVIMPPLAFLANPARWLWAIHHHRATLSAAPNFAFELSLKSIREEDIEGLDLSSLRMVLNGAEPISASTIARFISKFAPFGFRPEAMAPVYGLAESSVGLAFPPAGRPPIIDRVERSAISVEGRAKPAAAEDEHALEFVACGRPLPGHQIRILDDAGRELPERREGRIKFKGPSATQGYFRDTEKTRHLFDGDWLESGDRGYVAAGDVYLTGRIKDMIIRAGRNIYPHELEEAIGNIEGIRKGCVVAFASADRRTGTERLVILAETRRTKQPALDALRKAVSKTCTELIDLPPDEVVLGPPRTVPKTSSGKIRRSHARKLVEAGLVGEKPRALWWQITRLTFAAVIVRARRGLRAIGDYIYAAWWWLALVVVAMVAWSAVVLLPKRQWRHAAIGILMRLFLRLTAIKFQVRRQADLPAGGVIFVANHSSYLDGPVLSAALPGLLSFVAKSELAQQFVAGPLLRRLGSLFVRRSDIGGSLEDSAHAETAARAGENLVFFPEGTLTRMPGVLEFHLGAFLVAARTGTPVVPVTISGTRSILRGEQWFPRLGEILVEIGTPHRPDGDDFDAAVQLRNQVRRAILEQTGEPDLAHERIILPGD